MKYQKTVLGEFLSRPNRFIAQVKIDGNVETVHVKNTGRCRELLLPNARVSLAESNNLNRKTKYDLIAVEKPGLGWVNIDSQVANQVVMEWLKSNPSEFPDMTLVHPEYRFGNSRIDFYMEAPGRRILLEVKGCTLEKNGKGYFPDAPTARGAKHLKELAEAIADGYESYLVYCIAMEGVAEVIPNRDMDPSYAAAFQEAQEAGVKCIFLPCRVTEDSIESACTKL